MSGAAKSAGAPSATAALPMRAGELLAAEAIDLYMAHYTGRDTTRVQRLTWWRGKVGRLTLAELSEDNVHAALEQLATSPPRFYAGRDAEGRPILRAKREALTSATLNRYCNALAAVCTWLLHKRVVPIGWLHPCRNVKRRPENNKRTRFLSDDEVTRLLEACRASAWPRLYVLVLMALTTGARKGELLGLQWRDVGLERAEARVAQTKNGDPRVLPLVPGVVDELRKFVETPSGLVFRSRRHSGCAYAFEDRFARALKVAGIRGVTFHTLRHSCASMLARNGATLLEIGDLLGHRQLQMTKRYSHLATTHKAALVNRVLGELR